MRNSILKDKKLAISFQKLVPKGGCWPLGPTGKLFLARWKKAVDNGTDFSSFFG
jgi:hypothetical protein